MEPPIIKKWKNTLVADRLLSNEEMRERVVTISDFLKENRGIEKQRIADSIKQQYENMLLELSYYARFVKDPCLNLRIQDCIKQVQSMLQVNTYDSDCPELQVLFTKKGKSLMNKGVKAGYLYSDYSVKKMTQGEKKYFAMAVSILLGIDTPWKTFGILWNSPRLGQVAEINIAQKRKDAIDKLFKEEFPNGIPSNKFK